MPGRMEALPSLSLSSHEKCKPDGMFERPGLECGSSRATEGRGRGKETAALLGKMC